MRAKVLDALSFVEVALPEPGKNFGAYHVEQLIGEGGMAIVFKARHVALRRVVALKTLHETTVQMDPDSVPRFLREARIAASLTHPGIVQVYDVGTVDGQPYIAMEWVEGRTQRRQWSPRLGSDAYRLRCGRRELLRAHAARGPRHRRSRDQRRRNGQQRRRALGERCTASLATCVANGMRRKHFDVAPRAGVGHVVIIYEPRSP